MAGVRHQCSSKQSTDTAATLGHGLRRGPSAIPGIDGLFATRPFRKGEIVTEYGGTHTKASKDRWYQMGLHGHRGVVIEGKDVKAEDGAAAGQWINDPRNSELVNGHWCWTDDGRKGAEHPDELPERRGHKQPIQTRMWFVATKPIDVDDEIFVSYGSGYWKDWAKAHGHTPVKLGRRGGKIVVLESSSPVAGPRKKPRKRRSSPSPSQSPSPRPKKKKQKKPRSPSPTEEERKAYELNLPVKLVGVHPLPRPAAPPPPKVSVRMLEQSLPDVTLGQLNTWLQQYWDRHLWRTHEPRNEHTLNKLRTDDLFVLALQKQATHKNPKWVMSRKLPPRFIEIEAIAPKGMVEKRIRWTTGTQPGGRTWTEVRYVPG